MSARVVVTGAIAYHAAAPGVEHAAGREIQVGGPDVLTGETLA